MRACLLMAVLLVGGCGDDDTGGGGSADMHVPGSDGGVGADLAVGPGDMACIFRFFSPFLGDNSVFRSLDCNCGCNVDSFENVTLSGMWGSSTTAGAMFTPTANVGLGMSLHTSGMLEQAGLVSVSPIAAFYLAGDFDVLVDYDFGSTPPPGESHLVLGVRIPGGAAVSNIEVARVHHDDGSDDYETVLGGIDNKVTTTATSGTLRLMRKGYTLTAYADQQLVATRITNDNPRLELTMVATLLGCTGVDGSAGSCGYTPRWHLVRLNSGTLVNQP